MPRALPTTVLIMTLMSAPALADHPVVEAAELNGQTLSVTLRHPDTGWDHYADGWEALTPDGTSLGIRELAHPHVEEQPFTRSLSGVNIPDGVEALHIRARCNDTGWSEQVFVLPLN